MVENLTSDALLKRLRTVLETWPLYRALNYTGAEDVGTLPWLISLYCSQCKNAQWWERERYSATDRTTADYPFTYVQYKCRNCRSERIWFYYCWILRGNEWCFFKAGQWPPPEEHISRELEHQLQGEDLDFYKKALRCRNFNYGLAALAYLRRVVENRMNDLLDLIAEAARESNFAPEQLKRLHEVKASKRFDDKVTYAAGILPTSSSSRRTQSNRAST